MLKAVTTETTATATATATETSMVTAAARAAMIRTSMTTVIETNQDGGNDGHYYECRRGGEIRW